MSYREEARQGPQRRFKRVKLRVRGDWEHEETRIWRKLQNTCGVYRRKYNTQITTECVFWNGQGESEWKLFIWRSWLSMRTQAIISMVIVCVVIEHEGCLGRNIISYQYQWFLDLIVKHVYPVRRRNGGSCDVLSLHNSSFPFLFYLIRMLSRIVAWLNVLLSICILRISNDVL